MVDIKLNFWIICCDDFFNVVIKFRIMLENFVFFVEVLGVDFLLFLRRKNKLE